MSIIDHWKTGDTSMLPEPRPLAQRLVRHHEEESLDLLNGKWGQIDLVDRDLGRYPWTVDKQGYVVWKISAGRVYLHKIVAARSIGKEIGPGKVVDHIDRNKLNNSRSNLRVVSPAQNILNRGLLANNKSGYIGVYLNLRGTYEASIALGGKHFGAGTYYDIEEAAWMRDQWAIALHGEFAATNFTYLEVPRQD